MEYGIIRHCKHCDTVCSGTYCNHCKTKEQRKEMDKTNQEHFELKGIKFNHVCSDSK